MQSELLNKARVFFGSPVRFPGLVTVLLGAYAFVPDNVARFQFWRHFATSEAMAYYLSSPWTGVILVLIGLSWLWFFRGVVHVHHGNLVATVQPVASLTATKLHALSPPGERFIRLLAQYQIQFAANKLIISRDDGSLQFDGDPERGKGVSIMRDIFGTTDQAAQARFADLVESIPAEYLRHFSEMRWDSPFVVALTDAALQYVRDSKL